MKGGKSNQRTVNIAFPMGGLNRKMSYRQTPPFTCYDAQNVRNISAIEDRLRGGSRPGLVFSHVDDIGTNVRMLSPMVVAMGDKFTAYTDIFAGTAMGSDWTQAVWSPAMPLILPASSSATIDDSVSDAAATLSLLPIDTTKAYTVEMFIIPWGAEWNGTYSLFLRMANSSPDIRVEGVQIDLTMTGADGAYTGNITSVLASTPTVQAMTGGTFGSAVPGWLSATVSGTTVTVFWNGTQIASKTVGAQTGHGVGFGLSCTVDGGLCVNNLFRTQYYSTGTVSQLRSMLIASASGNLFYESTYGRLTQVSSALTLTSDKALSATQEGQDLYIADYGNVAASGDDGTVAGDQLDASSIADWTTKGILTDDMVAVITNPQGTAVAGNYKITSVAAGAVTLSSAAGTGACSYRIERAPKIYSPLSNTITIATATSNVYTTTPGNIPIGCPLSCLFLDRLVLAGAEIAPHVWYMSRVGYPLDWDYSQTDTAAAVSGTNSQSGLPGGPITALIPHSDDYLLMACRDSLWKMTGDPKNGGALVNLSRAVGCVGPKAWCSLPDGSLLFMSLDGLYLLDANGDAYPTSISRETLPREFRNINPDTQTISLEYDLVGGGVHIFLTPNSSNSCLHWWVDTGTDTQKTASVVSGEISVERRAFWPFTLTSTHEPTATCTLSSLDTGESMVVLGGRDGRLRRFSEYADNDCGTVFTSYVTMGPIGLGGDGFVGTILTLDGILAEDSGDVAWSLYPSLTFEGATGAYMSSSGTWVAGINATAHPACRGQAFTMKLTGAGAKRWALEQINANIKTGGKRRLP